MLNLTDIKFWIRVLFVFFFSFFVHEGLSLFDHNVLTTSLFPTAESIFEHSKLYVTSILVLVIIEVLIATLFDQYQLEDNYFLTLAIAMIFMVFLNNFPYVWFSKAIGEHNMVFTLIYFGINIILSYLLAYIIVGKVNPKIDTNKQVLFFIGVVMFFLFIFNIVAILKPNLYLFKDLS